MRRNLVPGMIDGDRSFKTPAYAIQPIILCTNQGFILPLPVKSLLFKSDSEKSRLTCQEVLGFVSEMHFGISHAIQKFMMTPFRGRTCWPFAILLCGLAVSASAQPRLDGQELICAMRVVVASKPMAKLPLPFTEEEASMANLRAAWSKLVSRWRGPLESRLSHYTTVAGREGINESQSIKGRNGIFAVYSSASVNRNKFSLMLTTGLPPKNTVEVVTIPRTAVDQFKQVLPIGPFSGLKYMGNVRFAPPGELKLDGTFIPGSSLIKPEMLIYGPDVLIYSIAGGGYWYFKAGAVDEVTSKSAQ
jgi:hypothetical protein